MAYLLTGAPEYGAVIDIRHWAMWHANYIFYILDFFLMFLEHYPQYAPPHQTAQTLGP